MPKTRKVPATPIQKNTACVDAINELSAALGAAGIVPHHAPTAVITTTDSSTLNTSIALSNALKAAYEAHRVDTDAHVAADSTNTISAATATDLGSVQTLLNELKVDINAHVVREASHRGVGTYALIVSADASNQGTADTLANEIKRVLNRHLAAGSSLLQVVAS